MSKSFNLKISGIPDPHLYAVESSLRFNSRNCEAPSAKAPAPGEASFNFAANVSMTAYTPFVEEPRVQASDPAGEVKSINQTSPRAIQHIQPRQINNLRNKNKRLSKRLAKERVASRKLAFKLQYSEKYNEQLRMRLAAHEKRSQPREEVWIDLSTAEHDAKLLQKEVAALRKELQAQKEGQSRSKRAMEDLQVAHETLAACDQEVRAYKTELLRIQDNEQDLHDTRKQLAASQQELRACRDDLFRLQPVAQATDADISKDFESLCQRINDWIEGEISSFEDAHPNAKPAEMFSTDGSPGLHTFMQQYSEVGEYLVRNIIHHHLQEVMFNRDVFLFGISRNLAQMLQGAERSMAMLEPRREYETINTWRSETLTALSTYKDFADERRRRLVKASQHIFRSLSSVFPIIDLEHQSFIKFCNKIMFPAAELASQIQVSSSTYEFVMPKNKLLNPVPVRIDHLATVRMVEVKTRKNLKSDSKVIPDRHGSIGVAILPLEPVLYRRNRGQHNTTLSKECWLVKLDKPLLKGSKALA